MPFRMVSVTARDMSSAPRKLHAAAMQKACFSVITPAPTDVPKAFATSFAPMAMAMRKQTRKPAMTIHKVSSRKFDIVVLRARSATFWSSGVIAARSVFMPVILQRSAATR
jgi:hypothetical protein